MLAARRIPTSSPASRLGSFDVLDEIAQGGMGVVYLARQPALDRLVVVKKIRKEFVADATMVERFQREARAAAAVHHQNVVAVYDCFSLRGDHYIAQEYVDGQDLRSVLDQLGRLDPWVAQLVALEIARGLEEIHARGIVHRDLKPANVLVGRDGGAKIADFGIALESNGGGLTRPGTLVGSVPYLSPEQMLGERIDCRSDLFLFGILLYEMVTGHPPFQESNGDETDTLLERMNEQAYDSPRKHVARLPGHVVRLIRACLRPKPARRMPSATDLRRRLERHLGNVSPADCRRMIAEHLWERGVFRPDENRTDVRSAADRGRSVRQMRWSRWGPHAAAAGVLLAFAVAGYALGTVSSDDRQPPREPARAVPAAAPPPEIVAATPAASPAGLSTREAPAPPVAPIPAQVRFVVWPWAEIRIDDDVRLTTPRAEPVALTPGTHRVVVEHPRFGRHTLELDLAPGEQRVVRHAFEGAPGP